MAGIFVELGKHGHEELVFFQDKAAGLRAVIGIHSTLLGPALGGCRMWSYASEEDATRDVLRLSRGMTYKAAVAGLRLGGGKAVVIGDARVDKTEALLKAFGRAVDTLNGRYITAEDVGMKVQDIDVVRTETRFAVGGSNQGGSGDPSSMTAFGVFQGIKAALKASGLGETLEGLRVAVQGVGNVGYHLASYLSAAGAKLMVADVYPGQAQRAVDEFGAMLMSPEDILSVECDILAPCALGAILNHKTIPQLQCQVVAGAANNQLESESDGYALFDRGILYAPDYAINAGGLINVAAELEGYDHERVLAKVSQIYTTMSDIFARSHSESIPPHVAADRLAEDKLKKVKDMGCFAATGEFGCLQTGLSPGGAPLMLP